MMELIQFVNNVIINVLHAKVYLIIVLNAKEIDNIHNVLVLIIIMMMVYQLIVLDVKIIVKIVIQMDVLFA